MYKIIGYLSDLMTHGKLSIKNLNDIMASSISHFPSIMEQYKI